jgi:hypothetical protein
MTILKTSSESFPASRDLMKDITYVLRVRFGELAEETTKIVGKPIACHKCNGFLLNVDQIKEDPKVGRHFICPFCGTLNVIEGEIIFAGLDSDFVIEPPKDTDTTTDVMITGGKSLLGLIDVSGSMSGANLAAVKRSLSTSIDSLAANSPDTLFGLIEFESSVLLRDLENGQPIELPRETYANFDSIVNATKKLLDKVKLVPVGKNSDSIKKHVQALRDQGGTALGPAIAMANEGIGALEGYQVTPATEYYENLGNSFRELGTSVDVVGIASGGAMELKTLGLLPEGTGGQMYYVTPNELDQSISELAGASLLGRDVEVRLVTPLGVKVKDASGVSRSVIDELIKKKESKIGVVGENHELYFEVEPESEIKDDEVPIQVQVSYTDEEGARRVRVVTTKLKVAKKEDEVLETLDPTVGAVFVTQKAGEEAFRGEREKGKDRITAFRAALKTKAAGVSGVAKKRFERANDALETEEEELEMQMQEMEAAPTAAPSAAADMVSTQNLRQMKRSSKDLFDDEEE